MRADEARLQEVLRLRKENFDAHAGPDTRDARQLVPGRSWAAWSRALGLLMPAVKVADLGCGEGYLTIEAARWAARVVAVDRSEVVLKRAKALARRRRVSNVIWKKGELEKLPMKDASVDVAHAVAGAAPRRTTRRAPSPKRRGSRRRAAACCSSICARTTKQWVRAKLGDRRLGFDDDELRRMLTAAGLSDVKVGVGARKAGDPFTVLIAAGTQEPSETRERRARPKDS